MSWMKRIISPVLTMVLFTIGCGVNTVSNLETSIQSVEAVQKTSTSTITSTSTSTSTSTTSTSTTSGTTTTTTTTTLVDVVRDAASKIVGLFVSDETTDFIAENTGKTAFFSVNKTSGLTKSTPFYFPFTGCTGDSFTNIAAANVPSAGTLPFAYRFDDPSKGTPQQSIYIMNNATVDKTALLFSTQDGGACLDLQQDWGATITKRDAIVEVGSQAKLYRFSVDNANVYGAVCTAYSTTKCIQAVNWSTPSVLSGAGLGTDLLTANVFSTSTGPRIFLAYYNGSPAGSAIHLTSCSVSLDCTNIANWVNTMDMPVTAGSTGQNPALIEVNGSLHFLGYDSITTERKITVCPQNTDCSNGANWTAVKVLGTTGTDLHVVQSQNTLFQIYRLGNNPDSLVIANCPVSVNGTACGDTPGWGLGASVLVLGGVDESVTQLDAISTTSSGIYIIYQTATNDTKLITCPAGTCNAASMSGPTIINQASTGGIHMVQTNDQLYALTQNLAAGTQLQLLHCSGLASTCQTANDWGQSNIFQSNGPTNISDHFFDLHQTWIMYTANGSRFVLQIPYDFTYRLSVPSDNSILPSYQGPLVKDTTSL